MTAQHAGPRVFFDALLAPHRSLSPRGLLLVMMLLGGVSFIAGVAFVAAGAWPVFGFFGLDVLFVYIAFRASYRAGRHYERVALTLEGLTVERVGSDGARRAFRFEPAWLRVEMADPPAHDSPLVLASHGRRLAIAGFLAPAERLRLAAALREALRFRQAALVGRA